MKSLSSFLLILVILGTCSLGQTRPTLRTEDVLKWRAANPERAEHFIPKTEPVPSPDKSPARARAEFEAAEKSWNVQLFQARQLFRDYERRANQADLEALQGRNVIFYDDAQSLNINNARVEELRARAKIFRDESRRAQDAVNRLVDEGKRFGFLLSSLSSRLKNGEPNLEYYRTQYLALQAEIQDERSRLDLLQSNNNRIQTLISTNLNTYHPRRANGFLFYPNNGASDSFYLSRLRSEWEEVSGSLQASQTRITILQEQLDKLVDEGRRVGVPPGIFR